jgi:hypothetical protein
MFIKQKMEMAELENIREENDQLKEMNNILQIENENNNEIVQDLANEVTLLKE